MAFFNCSYYSSVLHMATKVNVVIPEVRRTDVPVLYLLHGLSDDNTIWERRTCIERMADKAGVAVIMPDGARSFYTNMKYGPRYYDYVSRELPEYVAATFKPLSNDPAKTFICGNSMGGYGALKIAFRNPERYAAVVGLSSVTDIVARIRSRQWAQDAVNIWGEDAETSVEGSEDDLFALAEKLKQAPVRPRIFQICGTEDFLYQDNIRFRDFIQPLGLEYSYFEEPGEHCWEDWNRWLSLAFRFFLNREEGKA